MSRESILEEINRERTYQQGRWGDSADDSKNTPWQWTAYIAAYATKWMRGSFPPITRDEADDFRAKMIKTAAIAVAAVESLDRQRTANGQAFYELPTTGTTTVQG